MLSNVQQSHGEVYSHELSLSDSIYKAESASQAEV